jgi:hypothetical protein
MKPTLFDLLILADALGLAAGDLVAELAAPRREKSIQAMLAAVRRRPGIKNHELARVLRVEPAYVSMLAARLIIECRLEAGSRYTYWPADAETGSDARGRQATRSASSGA